MLGTGELVSTECSEKDFLLSLKGKWASHSRDSSRVEGLVGSELRDDRGIYVNHIWSLLLQASTPPRFLTLCLDGAEREDAGLAD